MMTTTTTDQLSNDIGNGDDDGDDDGGDRGDGDGGRDEPDGPFHDKQARIAPKGSKTQRRTAQDKQCFKHADKETTQENDGTKAPRSPVQRPAGDHGTL